MASEILGTDEITQSDADKFVTHNTANRQIEGQITRVISRTNSGPPGSPSNGHVYIVDVASGVWAGFAVNSIAHYFGGQWVNYTQAEGVQRFWVNDEDIKIVWDGSAWVNEAVASMGGSFTAGAVVFGAASGGALAEDDSNLHYDDTNDRFGIGTNAPDRTLTVAGGIGQSIKDNPTVSGQVIDATNLNGAYGVHVSGGYAYVASLTGNSLTVVDIVDPASPTVLGQVIDGTNLNGAYGVHASGGYAYVTSFTGDSLAVVDVSDPSSPSVIGQVIDGTNLNGARGMHSSGNYVYVACKDGNSLTVVNVSDPTSPSVAGQVIDGTNLNGPRSTKASGNYAYVACETGDSLTVVDISDPTSPSVVGQIIDSTNLNGPYDVSISGNYAYVTCLVGNSLTVVDISDPTSPSVAGQVIDGTNLNGAIDVSISGTYAYVTGNSGNSLTVVDISDHSALSVVGKVTDGTNLNGPAGVHVSGNYAYVACNTGDSLTVVDINGVKLQAADIGNIKTHHIDVDQEAQVGNLLVKTGANIGGDMKVEGGLSLGEGSVAMNVYDEGTWTPVLSASVTGGTHTYSTQVGAYIRVGNLVTVSCIISISSKDAAINGNLRITGLPFTSKSTTGYTATASVGTVNSISSTNKPVAILAASTTNMNLYEFVSGSASTLLTQAHLGGTPSIHLTLTYMTE